MTEGIPPKEHPELSAEFLEELRAELERQLRRLEKSMSVTDEASRPVELDQQAVGRLSRMDALQNQHLTRNLQERERARHGALISALKRIENGRYGFCEGCGAPLAPGRLLVYPEAERCGGCQS